MQNLAKSFYWVFSEKHSNEESYNQVWATLNDKEAQPQVEINHHQLYLTLHSDIFCRPSIDQYSNLQLFHLGELESYCLECAEN